MTKRVAMLLACVVCGQLAWAGGPVLPRQAVKGTLLVISNLERANYEELIGKLRPKYAEWVTPDTAKGSLNLPTDSYVCLQLFLMQSNPQGVNLDPSWAPDLPLPPETFARPDLVIAAKSVPGARKELYSIKMLLVAPTEKLLAGLINEAMALQQFPLDKPIVHPTVDLRAVQAVACLPSLVARAGLGPVGDSAEAALYRSLIGLKAFQVVGREAMPVPAPPNLSTVRRVQELGRELGVDALVFAAIEDVQTSCKEYTEYTRSNKKRTSPEAQKRLDEYRAAQAKLGRIVTKTVADPDEVWAAPYQVYEYTTTLSGRILMLNVADGKQLLEYPLDGRLSATEKDEPRVYAWYKIRDLDSSDSRQERQYTVRARITDAAEIARQNAEQFGAFLELRALLRAPGEPPPTAVTPQQTVRILAADKTIAFIDSGQEQGVRVGDEFSVWQERELKDPQTGATIEKVRTRIARLRVVEVFARTARCDILEQQPDTLLEAGMIATAQ